MNTRNALTIFLLACTSSAITIACSSTVASGSNDDEVKPTATLSAEPSADSSDASSSDPVDDAHVESSDASDPPDAATSNVAGHAFTPVHAIAYPNPVGLQAGIEIVVSDQPIDCTSATYHNADLVTIRLTSVLPSGSYAVVRGAETSPGFREAVAQFAAIDGTCKIAVADATSAYGRVTVKPSILGAQNVEGSFDIAFESSKKVPLGSAAGTFKAKVCARYPAGTCAAR